MSRGAKVRWSLAVKRQCKAAFENGAAASAISEKTGVPVPTVWSWVAAEGWRRTSKGSQIEPDRRAAAVKMANEGHSLARIAAALDISRPTLYKWRAEGLFPGKTRAKAKASRK